MLDKEKLLEEADYYLDNDVTMQQAADHFKICKKTFQLHMKSLEKVCLDKFSLVQEKKQQNLALGAIKGGQKGKPTEGQGGRASSLSDNEAQSLARKIIDNDWRLREAEKYTDIPKSTISDNLTESIIGKELYSELSGILESHKSGKKK